MLYSQSNLKHHADIFRISVMFFTTILATGWQHKFDDCWSGTSPVDRNIDFIRADCRKIS